MSGFHRPSCLASGLWLPERRPLGSAIVCPAVSHVLLRWPAITRGRTLFTGLWRVLPGAQIPLRTGIVFRSLLRPLGGTGGIVGSPLLGRFRFRLRSHLSGHCCLFWPIFGGRSVSTLIRSGSIFLAPRLLLAAVPDL